MADRYTIGRGGPDEPGLILIADAKSILIVARSSEMALPHVKELVRLANGAGELLAVLKSFPGFTDNAAVGDQWIERVRAVIAKVESTS